MPGRAVGEGAGVSLGGAGVSLAGTGVAEADSTSAATSGVLLGIVVLVAASAVGEGTGDAVCVARLKGSVQVGTAVRAGVGAGPGLQAEMMSVKIVSHKTSGYRRIGRYSNPVEMSSESGVRRDARRECSLLRLNDFKVQPSTSVNLARSGRLAYS